MLSITVYIDVNYEMKLRVIRRKLANNFKNHQILEDPKYDKTSTVYDAYQ